MFQFFTFLLTLCILNTPHSAAGDPDEKNSPPPVPAGLDAYRMWDRWPYLRIGVRAYMRSTYDRRGGNESADASHFLYQEADDFNVILDVQGTGILQFARYNHWHGSPWHYEVDGRNWIVSESSSSDPDHPVKNSVFLPEDAFPNPLTWTWSTTRGADLMWVPIPFERSFRMAYSRTHYGTGYYIYHLYLPGLELSRPLRSWRGAPPDPEVLELIRRSGTDIAPQGAGVKEDSGMLDLEGEGARKLIELQDGPAMIRALKLSAPRAHALAFGRARIRMTWDGREHPSVDAPVDLFHGAGTFYNRTGREFLVKAFPVNVRFDEERIHLAVYFPMPYRRSARIELRGTGEAIPEIRFSLRRIPFKDPANWVGHFHATYRDHGEPEPGRDLVLLDTREVEGGGEWCGHLVGTSWIFSHRAVLNTLEGDPRFFFDDSLTPQAQGTGTEEWGGGGDYWGGRNMTLPFAGHPVGARNTKEAKDPQDLIESAYRFLLADLMPFGRNARIQLEHGGTNQSTEHYRSVTYWYGIDRPFLIQTDVLNVGDPEDEKRHRYISPEASGVAELTSRYEWGIDHLGDKEIYPATADSGRHTRGTSEFSIRLIRENLGVLLRRKLDYSYPNQRALVSVADDVPGAEFRQAGIWYLAGSNTCVYSNPRLETGKTLHVVQTSNRRWRDDEFLIGRELTRGRDAIRIRVKFEPVNRPLFPGGPNPPGAWSEFRYTAYCFVMPQADGSR